MRLKTKLVAGMILAIILPLVIGMTIPTWPQALPKDLANQSLEDLMNIEVTSVSRKDVFVTMKTTGNSWNSI